MKFEVIGTIDSGIHASGWSPDGMLLVLVTGDGKYIVMSSGFEVLVEAPICTDESGEDKQVNVGWGSKQTQFHGSLGKAAARTDPASIDSVGSSPDDDSQPRISWRGDGSYFSISILQKGDHPSSRKKRVIRVYDRQGALQSTSEPVAGLEHPLSWRPSGNLIASSQRFGFEGGGAGRPDRHDIVFFERNGLRHGEFRLRESGRYKVRELLWNSDSDILAVWIEREISDCGKRRSHWHLLVQCLICFQCNYGRLATITGGLSLSVINMSAHTLLKVLETRVTNCRRRTADVHRLAS